MQHLQQKPIRTVMETLLRIPMQKKSELGWKYKGTAKEYSKTVVINSISDIAYLKIDILSTNHHTVELYASHEISISDIINVYYGEINLKSYISPSGQVYCKCETEGGITIQNQFSSNIMIRVSAR